LSLLTSGDAGNVDQTIIALILPTYKALRIAIGSAVLAACLATNLLARAQSGPGWEVPADVVRALTFGPSFTVALIVVALVALFAACSLGNIPRYAIIGTVAVILTAVLLTAIVIFSEPAQWPVRHPNASAVARVLPLPAFVVSGVVFWLVGFYCVASSSHRGALQAVVAIMASIIGVVLLIAGIYAFLS
jgi:hypothetical protein